MPDPASLSSSPLAGEEGARRIAVGRRGGILLERARQMRREPTEAERTLWRLLRAKRFDGWKWRRKQRIDPYIVDFLCFEARLIVEADGAHHAERRYDATRDAWLTAQGFRILRFWNNDVMARPEDVGTAIHVALRSEDAGILAPPLPGPLPQGEREKKDT